MPSLEDRTFNLENRVDFLSKKVPELELALTKLRVGSEKSEIDLSEIRAVLRDTADRQAATQILLDNLSKFVDKLIRSGTI